MDFGKVGNLLKALAHGWTKAQLPTQQVGYSDYISALSRLYAATADPEKTAFVFRGILQQATQLGYSARWVERELKFEVAALAAGDRQRLMALYTVYKGAEDDSSLD